MNSFSLQLSVFPKITAIFMLVGWAGGAGATLQDPPVDDAEAADFIQTDLRVDGAMAGAHVEVKLENGIAVLTGKAESLAQAERAAARAVADARVRAVVNQVSVEPGRDAEVARGVRAALKAQKMLDARGVEVEVKHGRVKMLGKVGVWDEIGLARELVSEVRGVVAVSSDVEVTYEGVRSDAEIAEQLRFMIHDDPLYAGLSLQVEVRGGVVSLAGEVGSRGEFDRLIRRSYVTGVVDVQLSGLSIDHQLVMEGLGDKNYSTEEALGAMREAWALDERVDATRIRPELQDGMLRLLGTVGSEGEKEAAEAVARSVPGLISVSNELQVDRSTAGLKMASQAALQRTQ